jgi:hypothetical protein
MRGRFATTATIVAVVLAVGVAGVLVAVPDASGSAAPNTTGENASTTNETALGTQISSFMGASAAAANGSVENGMFSASVDDGSGGDAAADNRTALIDRRTDVLERRIDRLQARKAALIDDRENMSRTAYLAQMSAIAGQIESVRAAVNQTASHARTAGVEDPTLDRLRTEARNLTGPEIARLARNQSAVGLSDPDRGPPDDVPGDGTPGPPNGTQGPPNGSEGPPNGTQGPPDDRRGNESDDDPGNGNDDPGKGSDDDPGNGNDDPGKGSDDDPGNGNDDPGDGSDDPGNGNDDPGDGSENKPGTVDRGVLTRG